jgi:hypothetical protein
VLLLFRPTERELEESLPPSLHYWRPEIGTLFLALQQDKSREEAMCEWLAAQTTIALYLTGVTDKIELVIASPRHPLTIAGDKFSQPNLTITGEQGMLTVTTDSDCITFARKGTQLASPVWLRDNLQKKGTIR